jgi:hypothetical protein
MRTFQLISFSAAKYAGQPKVIFGVMNEVRNPSEQVIPRGV